MKIYTSNNCPNCKLLKLLLSKKDICFEEVDGTTTKSVAYLRARKIALQLPIIEQDSKFYTFDEYKELL